MDFRQFYISNLESYLLDTAGPCFAKEKQLSTFDFFCIVIWKANRAKSKIADKLRSRPPGYDNLDAAVHALTTGLAKKETEKERLRYLWEEWGLSLAMASAILTVLYPDEFTVYDVRVCDVLREQGRGSFHRLSNPNLSFEGVWRGYEEYKRRVEESAPKELSLRDKDRYLWGKSFYEQLKKDIEQGFKHSRANR